MLLMIMGLAHQEEEKTKLKDREEEMKENKEELQLYYKITDEDIKQITKEWPEEFLVPFVDA